jgi:hypothetical protein
MCKGHKISGKEITESNVQDGLHLSPMQASGLSSWIKLSNINQQTCCS